MVEGRIRADSEQPRRVFLRYFTVCMGIVTVQKWILGSDGFSRGSNSGPFLDSEHGIHKPKVNLKRPTTVSETRGVRSMRCMSHHIRLLKNKKAGGARPTARLQGNCEQGA